MLNVNRICTKGGNKTVHLLFVYRLIECIDMENSIRILITFFAMEIPPWFCEMCLAPRCLCSGRRRGPATRPGTAPLGCHWESILQAHTYPYNHHLSLHWFQGIYANLRLIEVANCPWHGPEALVAWRTRAAGRGKPDWESAAWGQADGPVMGRRR